MRILFILLTIYGISFRQIDRSKVAGVEADARILTIDGTTAKFDVTVHNLSERSIFLEESRKNLHDLHAVGIDVESEPDRWTYVGPKLDAGASSVFELRPSESAASIVAVYGLSRRSLALLQAPKPRYRVRLRYFLNEASWTDFGKSLGSISKPAELIALPK